MHKSPNPPACSCGLPHAYADCCGRYHAGEPAPNAEALMRSRYTAYVLGLEDYLLATWHASTRPDALGLANDTPAKWLGLTIRHTEAEGERAVVAFVARYKVGGRAHRLTETSRFVREEGRWYYVDGELEV
ncbi:YchJ family protein [Chitiniphilus eburneus]|uniref:UPF0225 protein FAZ21_17520 n=1 Tax=Chitiniphilus eburneus TaxID=2571148 RepID=A0A4U0PEP4_9NEIS|nr:YchJ family metal-binding protein [Chitiniphilus eburneus]TJZ66120.1 hypothetical protein FAZ21_17520 [Chitiniphilus eburneus]